MFLVGLTGGIATGKSTVASMFQEFGIKVIDSDVIARQVVEPGTIAWKKIKNEFGSEVILPDGMIDRQKLGQIIFSNSELRKKLNSITHPEIYKTIFWECLKLFLLGKFYFISSKAIATVGYEPTVATALLLYI
ncbi:dephospho-CoA kinase domain-containing protein-like [Centruroides sculpturatus]|uniref:dephospho-CoA kinase domain-containing protein-like n=1 Tax=Centruroides sculpturatus TaxID=218467 RepID=UPI000C6E650B|nr:dephospho-CoA kinase domain-containing protein-like [Centruroides sculpturatus]